MSSHLPLVYVQSQLGHADISTTVRYYGHLERSYMRGAAAQAEEAVWEKAATQK